MSWLVDVADAITGAMNEYELWSLDFDAERSYADWAMELKDLDTLHVDVVPSPSIDGEIEDRRHAKLTVGFDVGIRKRFGTDDQDGDTGRIERESIDELVNLVQEIWLWLIMQNYRVTDAGTAVWKESRIVSGFSRRDLRKNRQFSGIIRTSYEVERSLG